MKRQHGVSWGFTLIEVMVVMVIIAILVTVVSLSLKGDRAGEALEEEAQRLTGLLNLAREEAVMRDLDLALAFMPDGYLFAQRQEADDSGEEIFLPLSDDPMFRPRNLPGGAEMQFVAQQNAGRTPTPATRNPLDVPAASASGEREAVKPGVLMLANDMFWPQGMLILRHPSTSRVLRIVIEQDGARILPEEPRS
ncbi:MAG: type II secretion system minor pseudopilin GspH [Pseudomonadota bacterium]